MRLALENNLGIRVARIDPQIEDLGVAQARAAWYPTLTSTLQSASTDSPNNSFLSGADGTKTSDARVQHERRRRQTLPWGGRYNVGWDSSRSTTTNLFSNFSPQVRSSLALTYAQPLLRDFSIDSSRQQLLLSEKNREIADVTLRQAIAATLEGGPPRLLGPGIRDRRRSASSASRSSWRANRCATRERGSKSAPRRRSTRSRPKPKWRCAKKP